MTRYTAPEIIGMYTSDDISDIHSYQPTLFPSVKVYTVGSDYWCCPTKGQKPPVKDRDGFDREFKWTAVWTHEKSGRTVYVSRC